MNENQVNETNEQRGESNMMTRSNGRNTQSETTQDENTSNQQEQNEENDRANSTAISREIKEVEK